MLMDRYEENGSRTEFPGNRLEISGKCTEFSGNRLEISGKRAEFPGNRLEINGKRTEFFGNRLEITGKRTEFFGNRLEIAGKCVEFLENCLDIPGNHGEVPGDSREWSGTRPGNYGLKLEGFGASREFSHVQREHGNVSPGSPDEADVIPDACRNHHNAVAENLVPFQDITKGIRGA